MDVRVLMPRYGWIPREQLTAHPDPLPVRLAGAEHGCAILEGALGSGPPRGGHPVASSPAARGAPVLPVYFLEHDALYDREGVYGPPGAAYADNCARFALLSRSAIELCYHLDWWPHVIHAHDWPAALVPVYLNVLADPRSPLGSAASVLTIHNLAFQGWFKRSEMATIDLGWELFAHLGLEAYDAINLLKGGIHHASLVTTVSPTYAREIQTPAYGEGLDSVLRSRRADLFGVLNGIDEQTWDPTTDPLLPRRYTREDLSGKRYCKAILQQRAGLDLRPDVPLVGMVTRLSVQKGVDIVAAALLRLLELDIQLVLLGTGAPWAEQYFIEAARQHERRFCAWMLFDEERAHLIEAGADFFLMPSRWEPCGLNQMYSMRYGTIPILRATGGLEDSGESFDSDTGSGNCFKFRDLTPETLVDTVGLAAATFRDSPTIIKAMIQSAMGQDFSWDRAAGTYEYYYRLAAVRQADRRSR
jgi:starch synthase